jgi:trimeric autotransporter adhesin
MHFRDLGSPVRPGQLAWRFLLAMCTLMAFFPCMSIAGQVDILNPGPGHYFGSSVHVLENGNIVATDPSNASVFLFDPLGQLISTTRTYSNDDFTVYSKIYPLSDGNFVICTSGWSIPLDGGLSVPEAGAATWVDGTTGLNGAVSVSNSLTGSQAYDRACIGGVIPLPEGRYVVLSWGWKNGEVTDAGAATLCGAQGACTGQISAANSLVGTSQGDLVGWAGVALANGDYVIGSPYWGHDGQIFVGAVTLCGSDSGCRGQSVSASNSLVGSVEYDSVGWGGEGCCGRSWPGIVPLDNGKFVVVSKLWQRDGIVRTGAVTLVDGATGIAGFVSEQNSLIGTVPDDFSGVSVTALVGGNYVVNNSRWDNGTIVDAGASTWCSGTTGCSGEVTTGNSLVGETENDQIGGGLPATALANGNYVVSSPWSSIGGVLLAGSATWCDGSAGCIGVASASNSLVGTSDGDILSSSGVMALSDGSYVVNSEWWDRDGVVDIGASLRCGNANGCSGPVSAPNALIGSVESDRVGGGIWSIALSNGNYVVYSNSWHGDGMMGALTWVDGHKGLVGSVSAANSFVGVRTDESAGGPRLFSLPNGDYVYTSPTWSSNEIEQAGAITLLRGYGRQLGTIGPTNSVIGAEDFRGSSLNYDYDALNDTLVVGKPNENKVTLLRVDQLFFNGAD